MILNNPVQSVTSTYKLASEKTKETISVNRLKRSILYKKLRELPTKLKMER